MRAQSVNERYQVTYRLLDEIAESRSNISGLATLRYGDNASSFLQAIFPHSYGCARHLADAP